MKIQELPISQIKADPNQPRKTKRTDVISELAENIKRHGLINAIEVDKENVIVTGELRWKACKKLGWDSIPCKVVDVGEDRFARQLSENVRRSSMEPLEIADAVQKVYLATEKSTKETAKKIGASIHFVSRYVSLLTSPKPVLKAVKEKRITPALVEEISRAPEEFKQPLRAKALKGQMNNAHASRVIVKKLKERPDKAKEILATNYKGQTTREVHDKLSEIAPTRDDHRFEDEQYFAKVKEAATRLHNLLMENPYGDTKGDMTLRINFVKKCHNLQDLPRMIMRFMKGFDGTKAIQQEIIEGETE